MNDHQFPHAREPSGATLPSQTHPSRHILMVDDDTSIRRFCAEALVSSGYHVETAEDGAVAWKTLQARAFNLLITDHSMPNVTGVELLTQLHAARMALPVIMATGSLPIHEFVRCPWLQPTATLLKPYTVAQLLGTVREVLHATDGVSEWVAPPMDWSRQSSTSAWKV